MGHFYQSGGKHCFSTCSGLSGDMEVFFPRQAQAFLKDFYHHMRDVKILPTPKHKELNT